MASLMSMDSKKGVVHRIHFLESNDLALAVF